MMKLAKSAVAAALALSVGCVLAQQGQGGGQGGQGGGQGGGQLKMKGATMDQSPAGGGQGGGQKPQLKATDKQAVQGQARPQLQHKGDMKQKGDTGILIGQQGGAAQKGIKGGDPRAGIK